MVVNAWFSTRLLVLNVYLDQTDQLGVKNRAILMMAGVTIECLGIPYVMGGDWNLTPQQIIATEWINTIDGQVIAPEDPTCRPTPSHTGKIIDYFIVSQWLAPLVLSIAIDKEDVYRPHCAVVMHIKIAPDLVYETSAMKAASFPEERPIQPRCNIPTTTWTNTPYHKSLNDHTKWVVDGCEEELFSIFDLG